MTVSSYAFNVYENRYTHYECEILRIWSFARPASPGGRLLKASRPGQIANVLKADPVTLAAAAGYSSVTQTVTLDRPFPLRALSPKSFERFYQKLIQITFPDADVRGHGLLSKHVDKANVSFPSVTAQNLPARSPLHLGRALLSSAMSAYSSMRWRMPLIPDVYCSICRSEPFSRRPT